MAKNKKIVYTPVKDWGRESKVIHGERQYVLYEVTSWTAMRRFQDLGGHEVLEAAHKRTEEWTSGEGTPFTWPATAKSFTLTQSEKFVVDSDEGIERALAVLYKDWRQGQGTGIVSDARYREACLGYTRDTGSG